MQIGVFAVGRMKKGPEQQLAGRYFDRFAKSGPALGLQFDGVFEITESRAQSANLRKSEEAERLKTHLNENTALIVLDERGKNMSSPDFAALLAQMRDDGQRRAVIALGGPDGHDRDIRQSARTVLSLGAMTWPHQIARILIAEQLYRAVTILDNHPYHRV